MRIGKSRADTVILIALVFAASVLVFPRLGARSLWEDEAQTAVVARNVLEQGLPSAWDGRNLVSIFPDHRDLRGTVYIWQAWLPIYLAAVSMSLTGAGALGARLPFALAFVLLIGLVYTIFRRRCSSPGTPALAGFLLAFSVPMLLHARQCRYYLLAAVCNVLVAEAYLRVRERSGAGPVAGLVAALTVLFQSFTPGLVIVALALGLHGLVSRPGRRAAARLMLCAAMFVVLNLPVAVYCRVWDRQFGYQPGYSGGAVFSLYLIRYVLTLNDYFFPLVLVAAAVALGWRKLLPALRRGDELEGLSLIVCTAHVIGFSLLSDYPFTRYLVGAAPFLALLGARCLLVLARGRAPAAWALAIVLTAVNWAHVLPLPLLSRTGALRLLWHATGADGPQEQSKVGLFYAKAEIEGLVAVRAGSPILDYVRSLWDPPKGPIDWIVEVLRKEASPEDRVKIAYGDLPLMFHTRLAVTSSSEVGPPAPEWIIPRNNHTLMVDDAFTRETDRFVYVPMRLPAPDLPWNNQPDPLYHYFRERALGEAQAGVGLGNQRPPPLTLYRKQALRSP